MHLRKSSSCGTPSRSYRWWPPLTAQAAQPWALPCLCPCVSEMEYCVQSSWSGLHLWDPSSSGSKSLSSLITVASKLQCERSHMQILGPQLQRAWFSGIGQSLGQAEETESPKRYGKYCIRAILRFAGGTHGNSWTSFWSLQEPISWWALLTKQRSLPPASMGFIFF